MMDVHFMKKHPYTKHALIVIIGTLLVIFASYALPAPASAQSSLVVCGTGDSAGVSQNSATGCQACHIFQLIDNIVRFLILISVSIASLLFAYAGFLYITAGGGDGANEAKKIFKDVFIGFVIALCGFLIVDTIIRTLVSGSFTGPSWSTIPCAVRTEASILGPGIGFVNLPNLGGLTVGDGITRPDPTDPGGGGVDTGDVTRYSCAGGGSNCQAVGATSVPVCGSCNGPNCRIDSGFADQLSRVGVGGGWCASSIGIESGHANACHTTYGNCIDATCGRGVSCSVDQARSLQDSFRAQSLWPVYELPPGTSQATLQQFRNAGVCAYVEPRSTGAHFSVYVSRASGAGQFNNAGCFQ